MIHYENSTSAQREYVETMIGREIYCCVSSLVSKLAEFDCEEYEVAFRAPWPTDRMAEELELMGCVWKAKGEEYGAWLEDDEPDAEDLSSGSKDEATREAFEMRSFADPYDDVYEHWAVSDWFGRRLSAVGERVLDIEGLDVWCRCTTGQSIFLDSCVWEALQDLLPEGGSNE